MKTYQLTKTIRFKLEPKNNALKDDINILAEKITNTDLSLLSDKLKKLYDLLKKYILIEEQDSQNNQESEKLNYNLKVKDKFLRTYTKSEYIEANIKKSNFHPISQVSYTKNILKNVLDRFNKLSNKYETLIELREEAQARKAEIALVLKELSNKNNFIFLKDFVYYSQDNKNEDIKSKLESIIEELGDLINKAKQHFLPSQSSGVVIAKASLNYYTINKNPVDYDKEILEERKSLDYLYENNPNNLCRYTFACDGGVQSYRDFITCLLPEKVTIREIYNKIKEFKAEAKSKFYEAVNNNNLTFKALKQNHPLFTCTEQDFQSFQEASKEITRLNSEINKLELHNDYKKIKNKKNEIKRIKQQRGKNFLMSPPKDSKGAKQYIKLSNLFKAVASKYGKQRAKIKSLEQEKIQSQLLNYWLLLHQIDKKRHELILVPKENRLKAKTLLENSERITTESEEDFIIWFKSLTLRALRKLCFSGTENSFAPELKKELTKYSDIKASYSLEDFKTDKELIQFYQTVISSDYFNTVVDINDFNGFDLLAINEYSSIQQFEIELEKICYTKIKIKSQKTIDNLIESCNAQILSIESYDLNKDERRITKDKTHTNLWNKFWSKENTQARFSTRLNPEIAITYRLAKDTRLKKYGLKSDNYHPKKFKQNRYCHPQLSLTMTLTENANSKTLDFAYLNNDKLSQAISDFNKEYNQQLPVDKSKLFYYGIDRGNDELATLATIAKFDANSTSFLTFDIYKLKDITHRQEITLQDGTTKIRYAIDNISYFIDEEKLFERYKSSTIDLTTAKLIKGKIVANGDVKTYLKLKLLSAKRRLYEYYSTANIDNLNNVEKNIYFDDTSQVFCIKTNDNNPKAKIYYFREELKCYLSKKNIEKQLKEYLHDLKKYNQEKDILTAEKINHLRDALSANMVGILAHIYKEYSGIIVLEDLEQATLNSQFMASNESIGRRLEWALYKKLQQFSVVPPNLKDTIILRKSNKIKQFGAIIFIPEEYTSQTCPKCEKIATLTYDDTNKPVDKNYKNKNFFKKKSEQEKAQIKKEEEKLKNNYHDNKFNHRKFICPYCGFDTSKPSIGFENIDSPDSLASFNVAKRGYNYLLNPPKENQKKANKGYNYNKQKPNKAYRQKPTTKTTNKPATHNPFSNLDKMLKK